MRVKIFQFAGRTHFDGILSRIPNIGEYVDLPNGERLKVVMIYTKTYDDSYNVMVEDY